MTGWAAARKCFCGSAASRQRRGSRRWPRCTTSYWRAATTRIGKFVGGRIWRYELEPVDGGTLVKESWDISQESAATRPLVRKGAEKTRKDMASTLERIEGLVT